MDDQQARESLVRIGQGDERAMEQFYRAHASGVVQFAQRTLNNPTDAAEVVNLVMLDVWRKSASFEGKSTVRTWLFSMTRFKAIDLVRRKARHDGSEDLDDHHDIACDCDLLKARDGAEQKEKIAACMQTLKDGFKQVVYLTFYEGMAYPEIADIMGIPTGTVKTRMMQAKKLLMACLSRDYGVVAEI